MSTRILAQLSLLKLFVLCCFEVKQLIILNLRRALGIHLLVFCTLLRCFAEVKRGKKRKTGIINNCFR